MTNRTDWLDLSNTDAEQATYKRSFANFFIPKRIPKLNIPALEPIPDPQIDKAGWRAHIQKNLSDGYLTDADLAKANIAADSLIRLDVDALNESLIVPYMSEDHEARYRQNQYFLFQWEFTVLSFTATVIATLATLAATRGNPDLARVFGVITTVIAAFTAMFVNVYNRERPQRKWYERRRIAESLRKQYYLYLMHLAPYDRDDHKYLLDVMIDRIRNSSSEALPAAANAKTRRAHTEREIEQLTNLYITNRVNAQMKYYKRRGDEFDFNADWTFLISSFVPLLVTALSALNTLFIDPFVASLIVVMPSFAALFLSFQRVYDWERQNQLYEKAYRGLKTAKIIRADIDEKDAKRLLLVELVSHSEGVLTSEADQWGASLANQDEELSAETVLEAFIKKSGLDENDKRVQAMRSLLKLPATSSGVSTAPSESGKSAKPAVAKLPPAANPVPQNNPGAIPTGPEIIDPLNPPESGASG